MGEGGLKSSAPLVALCLICSLQFIATSLEDNGTSQRARGSDKKDLKII